MSDDWRPSWSSYVVLWTPSSQRSSGAPPGEWLEVSSAATVCGTLVWGFGHLIVRPFIGKCP
jgi:hypothetical protein